MLMPSIFGENLFDDFFTPFYYDDKDEKKAEKKLYGHRAQNLLRTDKEGNYIRRERYAGSMCRSFYVGDAVSEEDIHAKYEDGILKLSVPKKAPEKIEKDGYIAIEG